MSLINDALKRATQAQTPANPESSPDSPMEPAERDGSVGLPVYFMPILLFVVAGACFFLVRGWDAKRHAGIYPEPVTVNAREPRTAGPDPVPAAVAKEPTPQPAPANRQFGVNATPKQPTTTVAPEVDAPALTFRLQGIFYRPSRPSAVVNAQTVYVGDTIGNAKVKAITKDNITLVVNGETKVLTLR